MNELSARALIVEDDPVTRRILGAMLQKHGLEVVEANSVDTGKECYEAATIDVIFLDLELGESDGVDFCLWVRARDDGKNIPIIVCTSHNEREYVTRAIAAGATDFMLKPMQALTVTELLEKHVPRG